MSDNWIELQSRLIQVACSLSWLNAIVIACDVYGGVSIGHGSISTPFSLLCALLGQKNSQALADLLQLCCQHFGVK